jgi:hypothetical protein
MSLISQPEPAVDQDRGWDDDERGWDDGRGGSPHVFCVWIPAFARMTGGLGVTPVSFLPSTTYQILFVA